MIKKFKTSQNGENGAKFSRIVFFLNTGGSKLNGYLKKLKNFGRSKILKKIKSDLLLISIKNLNYSRKNYKFFRTLRTLEKFEEFQN